MAGVQQGIAQGIILIGVFHRGLIKYNALFHAVVLGKGTGGDIAHDDLQRHNADLFDQRLPVAQLLHIMGRNAVFLQHSHQTVAHFVVDNTLTDDRALFQAIKCGSIVLVGYDQKFGIIGCKNLFCLTLIQLLFLFHFFVPPNYFPLSP